MSAQLNQLVSFTYSSLIKKIPSVPSAEGITILNQLTNLSAAAIEVQNYNRDFKIGSRVYYKDGGPDDLGTITNFKVDIKDRPSNFIISAYVKWDNGKENDYYSILQLDFKIC